MDKEKIKYCYQEDPPLRIPRRLQKFISRAKLRTTEMEFNIERQCLTQLTEEVSQKEYDYLKDIVEQDAVLRKYYDSKIPLISAEHYELMKLGGKPIAIEKKPTEKVLIARHREKNHFVEVKLRQKTASAEFNCLSEYYYQSRASAILKGPTCKAAKVIGIFCLSGENHEICKYLLVREVTSLVPNSFVTMSMEKAMRLHKEGQIISTSNLWRSGRYIIDAAQALNENGFYHYNLTERNVMLQFGHDEMTVFVRGFATTQERLRLSSLPQYDILSAIYIGYLIARNCNVKKLEESLKRYLANPYKTVNVTQMQRYYSRYFLDSFTE